MSDISKLTSNKTKVQYGIVYCLYLAAYLVTPLVVMQFIDAVVALDYGRMVHYALYYLCAFALTQVISYAFFHDGRQSGSRKLCKFLFVCEH